MGILFGLDMGEKRVGLARSDETETIAEALATLCYGSRGELLKKLKTWVEELHPEKFVVGLPQTLKGEMGTAAQKVNHLVEWLKPKFSGEWILWDERFTTVEAERILLEADLSREKRRDLRDRIAAQRILQTYLDSVKHE